MKKGTGVHQQSFRVASSRLRQRDSRHTLRWVLVAAVCLATFLFVLGIASAAQNSGSGGYSPAKAKLLAQEQQRLAEARAHPRPKPAKPVLPPPQPAPQRQAGIVDLGQGPFASSFAVHDLWQGPVGSDWVLAYAGGKMNPDGTPGLGGIALYTETINNQGGFDLHPQGTFLAPNGTTALVITAQQGDLLLLRSVTGQHLTFNLISRQFQE